MSWDLRQAWQQEEDFQASRDVNERDTNRSQRQLKGETVRVGQTASEPFGPEAGGMTRWLRDLPRPAQQASAHRSAAPQKRRQSSLQGGERSCAFGYRGGQKGRLLRQRPLSPGQ